MLLDYVTTRVNGCMYWVGVFPIIRGKTNVIFYKRYTNISATFCIEDDEVVSNIGLSEREIESIRVWINNNRLSLWKTAQNTPTPTQEQIRSCFEEAVEDLKRLDKKNPFIASMVRKELVKAFDKEMERRERGADDSWEC